MERRTFMKGAGATAGALTAGGIALNQLSQPAAAGHVTGYKLSPPGNITTPNGEVHAVGYTFDPLMFEWSGLDTEATWGGVRGQIITEQVDSNGNLTGVGQFGDTGWTDWDAGALGDDSSGDGDGDGIFEGDTDAASHMDLDTSQDADEETDGWGGPNDANTGPGFEGQFYFDFGGESSSNPQRVYLFTGSEQDGEGYIDGALQYYALSTTIPASDYPVANGGNTVYIKATVKQECAVFNGDPNNGASSLVSDIGEDAFIFGITNESEDGTTTGAGDGHAG